MPEEVIRYNTYGEAAQAACLFVQPPPPERELKFYIRYVLPYFLPA